MSRNICSMCSGTTGPSVNYAKLVDVPIQQYGTILGDAPQRDDFRRSRGANASPCFSLCSPPRPSGPCPPAPGKSTLIQVPKDPCSPCPQFVCEPCPPPPPTKIWFLKSSPSPQKSLCLPIGGCSLGEGCSSSDKCKTILFCFPPQPQPPEPESQVPQKKKEEIKPIGYISRNKDVDFIGGKFIGGCVCGKKNGLSGNCPRISCQNNPGCFMNPPRCWPQFKEPDPPPPPPPDQKMICIPIQMVYCDKPKK